MPRERAGEPERVGGGMKSTPEQRERGASDLKEAPEGESANSNFRLGVFPEVSQVEGGSIKR